MSNSMFNQSQSPNASETNAGLVKKATPAQATAKQDDDGGVPLYVPPSLSVVNTVDAIANENITIGKPVGVSALFGGVARANRSSQTLLHNISSPLPGHRSGYQCAIDTNKIVTLITIAAGSDTLIAQVTEFNPDTLSATVGTALQVAAAVTVPTLLATICKLDTNKFIVFYLKDASATVVSYRVGTVSGTTISYGTEGTLVTAASTLATSAGFHCSQLGTDKGVLSFVAAIPATTSVVVFSVSGTVATPGPITAVPANLNGNYGTVTEKIGTDKFVLCNYTVNAVYAAVATVSGLTPTFGAAPGITTSLGAIAVPIAQLYVDSGADDTFVVRSAGSVSTTVVLTGCTVSGLVISPGTPKILGTLLYNGNIVVKGTKIYVVTGVGDTNQRVLVYELSGNTIVGSPSLVNNVIFSGGQYLYDLGTYFVGLSTSYSATQYAYWVQGMANNWIGIAQETVLKGATLKVLVRGVDENQSNLIFGAAYKVGAAVVDETGNLVLRQNVTIDAGFSDIKYGIAFTDTDLLI